MSCDLVLAEVPRRSGVRSCSTPGLPRDLLLARAGELLEAVALHPVDRGPLLVAGALDEPAVRTLDAIHVAAAGSIPTLDAFVT